MARVDNQANTRGWALGRSVAPALLLVAAMGCLNPNLYDEVQLELNHAPTVDDIAPPTPDLPLDVKFGEDCREETFRAVVDDVDEDVLTARFNIILPRLGPPPSAVRVLLLERELTRLENPPPGGPFYDLQPFALSQSLLQNKLGAEFEAQAKPENDPNNEKFQVLELRISDGDFVAGTDDVPAGRAQFVATWTLDFVLVDSCAGGE